MHFPRLTILVLLESRIGRHDRHPIQLDLRQKAVHEHLQLGSGNNGMRLLPIQHHLDSLCILQQSPQNLPRRRLWNLLHKHQPAHQPTHNLSASRTSKSKTRTNHLYCVIRPSVCFLISCASAASCGGTPSEVVHKAMSAGSRGTT